MTKTTTATKIEVTFRKSSGDIKVCFAGNDYSDCIGKADSYRMKLRSEKKTLHNSQCGNTRN